MSSLSAKLLPPQHDPVNLQIDTLKVLADRALQSGDRDGCVQIIESLYSLYSSAEPRHVEIQYSSLSALIVDSEVQMDPTN